MQSNRMWWDKAVCGLAHHPISYVCDKGNRAQSLAALRRGEKNPHNPTTKPKGQFWSHQPRGGQLRDRSCAMGHSCPAPTSKPHHKATSLGLTPWLLGDLCLSWERKTSQQGQQRLTLPGCAGIEPRTGLAPALKGTVGFLGSHCYLPCGNCSQSSHSPWLSKTCGMCFTASPTDEGCGRVKMVRHPRASSSSHQESFSLELVRKQGTRRKSDNHVPFLSQKHW